MELSEKAQKEIRDHLVNAGCNCSDQNRTVYWKGIKNPLCIQAICITCKTCIMITLTGVNYIKLG